MIDPVRLLFIEPQAPATKRPVIDLHTRRMTAALRAATPPKLVFCGWHTCICGALSSDHDSVLPGGEETNSLCVHYLAHHRSEVPAEQLERVLRLPVGEADPSKLELRGGRMVTGLRGQWLWFKFLLKMKWRRRMYPGRRHHHLHR
jgi:hypothetical protein